MKIAGIDLSMTATGIAILERDPLQQAGDRLVATHLIKSKPESNRAARFDRITTEICKRVEMCDLVAFEGYAHTMRFGQHLFMAELRGVIMNRLYERTWLVEIPITTWRSLVLGKGNLKKTQIIEYAKFKGFPANVLAMDMNVIEAYCVAKAALILHASEKQEALPI